MHSPLVGFCTNVHSSSLLTQYVLYICSAGALVRWISFFFFHIWFFRLSYITGYYVVLLLFSHSVVSDSLLLHGLQHARLPCPSLSPRVCSNSRPLSRRCCPTISSSVAPVTCLQSFPSSGFFPMSRFFTFGGQSIIFNKVPCSIQQILVAHLLYLQYSVSVNTILLIYPFPLSSTFGNHKFVFYVCDIDFCIDSFALFFRFSLKLGQKINITNEVKVQYAEN